LYAKLFGVKKFYASRADRIYPNKFWSTIISPPTAAEGTITTNNITIRK
jgi:hypothetical protein